MKYSEGASCCFVQNVSHFYNWTSARDTENSRFLFLFLLKTKGCTDMSGICFWSLIG